MVDNRRNLYALLVGIDNYKAAGDLSGCVNDIETIEQFLKTRLDREKYNEPLIEKLLNDKATRGNVIARFEAHLCKEEVKKDDVVLFYFAGHGSQELAAQEFYDLNGDEEAGSRKFETIVCHDSRTRQEDGTEIRDLADKEMRYLIAKAAKNEPHILVVSDCCHSKHGTRDTHPQERVRQTATDTRPARAYNEFCFHQDSKIAQELKQGKFPEGKHIFMSACLYTETAKEITVDGQSRGAFSYFLLKELNSCNAALSYKDLLREVSGRVRGYRRDQTPCAESVGPNPQDLNTTYFLGERESIKPREPYFNLICRPKTKDQPREWIIDGGAAEFLQVGSELEFYPEDCKVEDVKKKDQKKGDVRVTAVRMGESAVSFISGSEPPESSYKAVLTKQETVYFYLDGDTAALALVEEKLANSLAVGIERDRTKLHEYRLYARNQQFEIRDASDRLLVVPIKAKDGKYDANTAVKQVEHIARWTKTQQLENRYSKISKDAVEVSIIRDSNEEEPYIDSDLQLEQGSKIRLKLKNNSKQPLYCTILDIADDYSVEIFQVFPAKNDKSWICLQPGPENEYQAEAQSGSDFIQDIPFGMPDEVVEKGLMEYRDVLKLIVSTEPFTTSALQQFEQGSLSLADQKTRQMQLDPPVGDWMTKQITLTTVRTDSVELNSQPQEVSAGVQVIAPSGLQAYAHLKSPSSTTRSLSSVALPALLDNTQAFQFSTSRSVAQDASVLELNVDSSTIDAVTPESPITISVDRLLQPNERVLAVAHDGQFYFPIGIGQTENGKTEIKIERLHHQGTDEREIRQAIQLCFRKVALNRLGQKSSYAWLRQASLNSDGTVSYTEKGELDRVKAAVAKANKIVLFIHGIIGDTESMIPSVRYAKANVDGQTKSLEDLYDLVLAFDYESLNTSVEDTARELKDQLSKIGLTPNHDKTLHVLAHSMGGLVSRSFIEREGGNNVVNHLIMVGTPNGGSPWATVHDLATTLLSFGLNLSSVPIVPSLLENMVEAMSVTLKEMHTTKSSFLDELKASADPKCPYSIIAGSTALMDQASEVKQLLDALKKQMRHAIAFPFGDEENDIAVTVASITAVPQDRSPAVYVADPIACDHLSYFRHPAGLQAIANAVSRAFGNNPPDLLPSIRPSLPLGPQPNSSPTFSDKLSTGRPTTTQAESTSHISISTSRSESASLDGAVNTAARSVSSPSQGLKTTAEAEIESNSQSSPQTLSPSTQEASTSATLSSSNHETRTTRWFKTTHVVAIGINDYKAPIASLESAVNDARTIAGLFDHLKSTEAVKKYLLLGEKNQSEPKATKENILKQLESLKNEVGEEDRLVFYFAGHGIALPIQESSESDLNAQPSSNGAPGKQALNKRKQKGFLIPQDATKEKHETYLSMDDLTQLLSALPCHHCLIVLDCCHAGAIKWSVGQFRQALHNKITPSYLDMYIDSPAWQILASADETQQANDVNPEKQIEQNNRDNENQESNSPFVMSLQQALEGQADDTPPRLVVTATRLYEYLRNQVEGDTNKAGRRQTPQLFPLLEKHGRGEFVFLLQPFEKTKEHLEEKFPDPNIDDETNPYRALQSYTKENRKIFFGRKRTVEELSKHVHKHPLTVVYGTSGVGKSSLVNAGLIPKLIDASEQKSGYEPAEAPSVKWSHHEICYPGQFPADALEKALEKLQASNISSHTSDDTKCLLVIDQFEEVETQCRDKEQKEKFWNTLIERLKSPSNNLHIIITLRADFEAVLRRKFEDAIEKFVAGDDKSKSKRSSHKVRSNQPQLTNSQPELTIDWVSAKFLVRAMEREELQDVIEKPAEEMNVFFTREKEIKGGIERTLVDQILSEVVGTPGALPLLSFALYTMFRTFAKEYVDNEKSGIQIKREITWTHYESLGDNGVPGSLTKRADEECENLKYILEEVKEDDKTSLKVIKTQEEEESVQKGRQEMLKWMLLRMVTLDGGRVARRRVFKEELKYDDRFGHDNRIKSKQLDIIIQLFEQARLIVSGKVEAAEEKNEEGQNAENQEYVEPAHDALILNWARLQEWIKEEKENIILRDRLTPDVKDWHQKKKEEEEKASKLQKYALTPVGTALNFIVRKFGVNKELERLNKNAEQKQTNQGQNAEQKQNITASKDNLSSKDVSSSENTNGSTGVIALKAEEPSQKSHSRSAESSTIYHLKASDRLWTGDSRLDQLGRQLGKLRASKDSWLNQTEADFVLQSLIKRERGRTIRKIGFRVSGAILLGLLIWVGIEQQKTRIEQVRISRQSAEAQLKAHQDLKALLAALQAGRQIENLRPSWNPISWFIKPDSTLEAQVQGSLYKILYSMHEQNQLEVNRGTIYDMALSPDGQHLAIVGEGDTIILQDKNGNQTGQFSTEQGDVWSVAWGLDGRMATGAADGTVKLWKIEQDGTFNLENNKSPESFTVVSDTTSDVASGAKVEQIVFSPDGKRLATVGEDGTVKLWGIDSNPGKNNVQAIDTQLESFRKGLEERSQNSEASYNFYSVAFSPNGKTLAIVGESDEVILWDIKNDRELNQFKTDQENVLSVAFRTNEELTIGAEDGTIQLWRITTNNKPPERIEFLEPLNANQGAIKELTFDQGGTMLASRGANNTIKFWDTRAWNEVILLNPQIWWNRVKLWDTQASNKVILLNPQTWWNRQQNLEQIELIQPPPGYVEIHNLAFSPNGNELTAAGTDNFVRQWNSQGNQKPSIYIGEASLRSSIYFENNDNNDDNDEMLITISSSEETSSSEEVVTTQAKATYWNVASTYPEVAGADLIENRSNPLPLGELQEEATYDVVYKENERLIFLLKNTMALSPNRKQLALVGLDGNIRLFNLSGNLPTPIPTEITDVRRMAFSADGKLAILGSEGEIDLWDTTNSQASNFTRIETKQQDIDSMVFSSDSRQVTTSADGIVKQWDIKDDQAIESEPFSLIQPGSVSKILVRDDGQRWATITKLESAELESTEFTIKLWDSSGNPLPDKTINLSGQVEITSARFAPHNPDWPHNPDQLVISVQDNADKDKVILWDLSANRIRVQIETEQKGIQVAFSPNGQRFATADGTGLVKYWDVEGQLLGQFRTEPEQTAYTRYHTQDDMQLNLMFSPDGQQLATHSFGTSTLKLWDVSGAQPDEPLQILENINAIVFSPDGNQLVTAGSEGIRLWQLDLDVMIEQGCSWARDYLTNNPTVNGNIQDYGCKLDDQPQQQEPNLVSQEEVNPVPQEEERCVSSLAFFEMQRPKVFQYPDVPVLYLQDSNTQGNLSSNDTTQSSDMQGEPPSNSPGALIFLDNENNENIDELYYGNFTDGKRQGCGNYLFSNGRSYLGEFKDDKPNGFGVWNLTNAVYIGNSEDGRCDGAEGTEEGIYIRRDGLFMTSNNWENGNLTEGNITLSCDL